MVDNGAPEVVAPPTQVPNSTPLSTSQAADETVPAAPDVGTADVGTADVGIADVGTVDVATAGATEEVDVMEEAADEPTVAMDPRTETKLEAWGRLLAWIAEVKAPTTDWMLDAPPAAVMDGATELIMPAREDATGRFDAAMAEDRAGIAFWVTWEETWETIGALAEDEVTGATLVEGDCEATAVMAVVKPPLTVVVYGSISAKPCTGHYSFYTNRYGNGGSKTCRRSAGAAGGAAAAAAVTEEKAAQDVTVDCLDGIGCVWDRSS